MADAPEVAEAKSKLRALVVPAVDRLEELMESEHAGIRLGAAKEVLDRGGVPAKHDHNVQVEVGVDAEIESLISAVRRQVNGKRGDDLDLDIEDAELVPEVTELPAGEQAGQLIGVPLDERVEDAETLEHEAPLVAWWQATPAD